MNKELLNRFINAVLLGAIIWLLISRFAVNWLPYSMSVKGVEVPAIGGSCEYALYDKNGIGHYALQSTIWDYEGVAPLYYVSSDTLGLQKDGMGCSTYPKSIEPAIALTGTPTYPVLVSAKIDSESKWIRVGESYSFTASAKIGDYYPAGAKWITPLTPNESTEVTFTLSAPTFEISPTNDETQKTPMSSKVPAEQTWAITPIERANGDQYLVVFVKGDNVNANAGVNLEVRNILGIDPKFLSSAIAIGSVVAFLLLQTKTATDLFQNFKKKPKPPEKKRKK